MANEDAESYPLVKASVAHRREQTDTDILKIPPFIQFLARAVEVVKEESREREAPLRPNRC